MFREEILFADTSFYVAILSPVTYAGTYDHPAYGKAVISAGKDGLSIQWSNFNLPLQHWHYDTFRNVAPAEYALEGEFLVFNFEADGGVRCMHWLGQEFQKQTGSKKTAAR